MRRLSASLKRAFALAGPQSGGMVYDLTSGASIFSLRAGTKRPPASVEKLYTTVAVLKKFGTSAKLHTAVLGSGHSGGATWHGNLYLRGDGDPTFGDATFNRIWTHGEGSTTAQLAGGVARTGIRRVTGSLIGDGSRFDDSPGGPATHFAADIPDFGGQLTALSYDHGAAGAGLGPVAFAARQMATALRALRIMVIASPTPGKAPHGARTLATVSSPPMRTIVRLMNVPSDDLYAELLTKQLGARFAHRGTIGAGAHVISDVILRDFRLRPTILDGSGLDRGDRSSPREVTALLRDVWNTGIGRVLEESLPLIGVNGTTRRIAASTPARGHCVGKTGTLNGVTNLAGYCHSRGHRLVAFSLFLIGPTNTTGIHLLGQMIKTIQRY